jgi:hypothetical protein
MPAGDETHRLLSVIEDYARPDRLLGASCPMGSAAKLSCCRPGCFISAAGVFLSRAGRDFKNKFIEAPEKSKLAAPFGDDVNLRPCIESDHDHRFKFCRLSHYLFPNEAFSA